MKKLFLPFVLITIFYQVNAESNSQEQAKAILHNLRQDLTSLSRRFPATGTDINQNESEVSSVAKVWLTSPNQFRWEYINPAPQLIVANGEQVWIYDEDLEQVTIKPQDSSANPIYVLLDDSKRIKLSSWIDKKFLRLKRMTIHGLNSLQKIKWWSQTNLARCWR